MTYHRAQQVILILMCPFFLSLISSAPVVAENNSNLEINSVVNHSSHLVYKEKNGVNWFQSETDLQIITRYHSNNSLFQLTMKRFEPGGQFDQPPDTIGIDKSEMDETNGEIFGRFDIFDPYSEIAASVFIRDSIVAVHGSSKFKKDKDNGWSIGATLNPIEFAKIKLSRSHDASFPSVSHLYYGYFENETFETQGGAIFWDVPQYVNNYTLEFGTDSLVLYTLNINDRTFRPEIPIENSSPTGYYEATLDGKLRSWEFTMKVKVEQNLNFEFLYQSFNLDSRIRSFEAGRQFGYFGIADFDGSFSGVIIRHNRTTLGLYRGSGTLDLAGTVLAQPFLDGLLRFLGERRHLIANGEFSASLVNVKHEMKIMKETGLDLSANWLRIEPEFMLASWRPALFGIGIDDMRVSELKVKRLDLIQLGVHVARKWNRLKLNLNVTQWVPVSVSKVDEEEPTPSDPEETREKPKVLWGGFDFGVRLEYNF